MESYIRAILEAGVQAPSGGNSQPWEFKVEGDHIDVFATPQKDHPILNFRNRGTWVAHGALLENVAIAASALGYRTDIQEFPDGVGSRLTARITLHVSSSQDESLYAAIHARVTNRKVYDIAPLNDVQKSELLSEVSEIEGGSVHLTDDRDAIISLGCAVSNNEVVMLENKLLHNLFFHEVVWTEKQEQARGGGLYLKTLEMKLPQEKAFKMFRHWPLMRFANMFGMAKRIARDNAKVYSATPMMGIIVVEDSDRNFITAGRIMERLWLRATKMGLSFQLITGVLFLHQKLAAGEAQEFSDEHIHLLNESYQTIADTFGVKDGIIALLFRVGQGGEPSARSLKAAPRFL
jgi:hypothetical protein